MKRTLLLASTILLFVVSFSACKKDDENTKPQREKMLGRWQVTKVEVTTYSGSTPSTVTTTYGPTDYIEFQDNSDDYVELSLSGARLPGSFSTYTNSSFFIDFPSKDLECETNSISDNSFQFTGTIKGSSPRVTEKYYLSR